MLRKSLPLAMVASMKRPVILLLFAMMALAMQMKNANAAPLFCLNIPGAKPQCIFYSGHQCRQKAQSSISAFCSLNQKVMERPDGPGPWCLVTSSKVTQCYYHNFQSCQQELETKDAICVQSARPQSISREIDPNAARGL